MRRRRRHRGAWSSSLRRRQSRFSRPVIELLSSFDFVPSQPPQWTAFTTAATAAVGGKSVCLCVPLPPPGAEGGRRQTGCVGAPLLQPQRPAAPLLPELSSLKEGRIILPHPPLIIWYKRRPYSITDGDDDEEREEERARPPARRRPLTTKLTRFKQTGLEGWRKVERPPNWIREREGIPQEKGAFEGIGGSEGSQFEVTCYSIVLNGAITFFLKS